MMNILDEYKLFVKRIGLVVITNILIALSSLVLLPIMTKNYSIDDYGVWVQLNTTLALMPNLATLGLPYTMVIFLSPEKNKKKIQEEFYSIAGIVLFSTIFISALLFLFSNNVATALFNDDVNLAKLLPLIVFFACLNVFLLNFFRTFQQMKKYSIFLITQTYLGIFIVSYFAINGFGILMTALGLLIANSITFFIMLMFIISNIGFKIPKFKNMREYLSFGLPTIPSNLSLWIVDSSDRYVIGIILGTAFVGYYSPSYTLSYIVMMIVAPFSFLLPSLLPKYYDAGEIKKVKTFLKYSLKYFLLFAIPVTFGLSLLSKSILIIITTQEIASNGYFIVPFVVLSALLYGIYGIMSNMIILKRRTKILGIIWIIAAALNLILNIVSIPYIGILGAAIATLLAYTTAFLLTLYYLKFKFEVDLGFVVKSIISSILMSLVIVLTNPEGVLNVLIVVVVCTIVYLISIILLKGIKKEEFKFFKELLS